MSALNWRNKKILIRASVWSSPSKRRIPKLVVEDRAREVVLKVTLNEGFYEFEDTGVLVSKVSEFKNKFSLKLYKNRYLLPNDILGYSLKEYLTYYPIYVFGVEEEFYYIADLKDTPPRDLPDDWYKVDKI